MWLRYRKNHDDDDDNDDDDGDDDGDDGDDNDEYVERRRGKPVMVGGDRRADVRYEPMWICTNCVLSNNVKLTNCRELFVQL